MPFMHCRLALISWQRKSTLVFEAVPMPSGATGNGERRHSTGAQRLANARPEAMFGGRGMARRSVAGISVYAQ